MSKKNYRVWECKIVVDGDTELPPGFDYPPRVAAEVAVEMYGIPVIACFSGWGGKLSDIEQQIVERKPIGVEE